VRLRLSTKAIKTLKNKVRSPVPDWAAFEQDATYDLYVVPSSLGRVSSGTGSTTTVVGVCHTRRGVCQESQQCTCFVPPAFKLHEHNFRGDQGNRLQHCSMKYELLMTRSLVGAPGAAVFWLQPSPACAAACNVRGDNFERLPWFQHALRMTNERARGWWCGSRCRSSPSALALTSASTAPGNRRHVLCQDVWVSVL